MLRLDVDADDALRQLDKANYFRALRGGIAAALRDARTVVEDTPPQIRKPVAKYWTPKQRRWFFAALREGRIDVPYRRGISPGSQRITGQWKDSIEAGGTVGVLTNSVPYGKYLYDPAMQSKYHAGNWKNTEEMARLIKPRAADIIGRAMAGL
jgi:hypothetical protein